MQISHPAATNIGFSYRCSYLQGTTAVGGVLFCDCDIKRKEDFFMRLKESAKEFKNVKSLVMMAMLLALRLALGFATTIQITESIKIGYTIFPMVMQV